MRLGHIRQASQSGSHARTDVVAERDGTDKTCAVDTKLFACRQSSRYNRASRMRLRKRMRIVRLVRVSQHPIGHCGLDWTANHIGRGNGGDLLAFVSARELDGKLS